MPTAPEGEGSPKDPVQEGYPKHILQQTLLAPDPGGFPNTVHVQAQNLLVALAHIVPGSNLEAGTGYRPLSIAPCALLKALKK